MYSPGSDHIVDQRLVQPSSKSFPVLVWVKRDKLVPRGRLYGHKVLSAGVVCTGALELDTVTVTVGVRVHGPGLEVLSLFGSAVFVEGRPLIETIPKVGSPGRSDSDGPAVSCVEFRLHNVIVRVRH